MAYTIHITKKENWWDDEPKISQKEWERLKNDGILKPVEGTDDFSSLHAIKDNLTFWFFKGNINCNPPDDASVQTIKEVASSILNAKVQGDDGEIY